MGFTSIRREDDSGIWDRVEVYDQPRFVGLFERIWRTLGLFTKVYNTCFEDSINEAVEEEMEVDGCMVDNGIGSYEYWGSRGFHQQWDFEVTETSGDLTASWSSDEVPDFENLPTGGTWSHSVDGGEVEIEVTIEVKSILVSINHHAVLVDGLVHQVKSYDCEAEVSWSVESAS